MDKIKSSKKSNLLKWITLATLAVLLIAFSLYYFYFKDRDSSQFSEDGINYSPATKEDRAYNDQIKENIPDRSNADADETNSDSNEKKSVEPVISAWGQPDGPGSAFKVNGYVPGIIESGGACEIILSSGSKKVSASKAALENAQNTSCGQLVIPYDQLQPGLWQAVLSYESINSSGKSKPVEVEVK